MISFPAALPAPTINYSLNVDYGVLRTKMDAGNYRQRRRFTESTQQASVKWMLSDHEFHLFEGAVFHLLNGGADWFKFFAVSGGGLVEHTARFVNGKFNAAYKAGNFWLVTAKLDILEPNRLSEQDVIDGLEALGLSGTGEAPLGRMDLSTGTLGEIIDLTTLGASVGGTPGGGVSFTPDGSKIITGRNLAHRVYALSTAWRLSTAQLSSQNNKQGTSPQFIEYAGRESGTTYAAFRSQSDGGIRFYGVDSPYDIATATQIHYAALSRPRQSLVPFFHPEGTRIYLSDSYSRIWSYSPAAPHDYSTLTRNAGYGSAKEDYITISRFGDIVYSFNAGADPTTPNYIKEQTLSTPWDTATISSTFTEFPLSAMPGVQEAVVAATGSLQGVTMKPDGTAIYLTVGDNYNCTVIEVVGTPV